MLRRGADDAVRVELLKDVVQLGEAIQHLLRKRHAERIGGALEKQVVQLRADARQVMVKHGMQDVAELNVHVVGQHLFRVLGEIRLCDRLIPDAVIAAAGGVFQKLERCLRELWRLGGVVGEEGVRSAGPDLADDPSEQRKDMLALRAEAARSRSRGRDKKGKSSLAVQEEKEGLELPVGDRRLENRDRQIIVDPLRPGEQQREARGRERAAASQIGQQIVRHLVRAGYGQPDGRAGVRHGNRVAECVLHALRGEIVPVKPDGGDAGTRLVPGVGAFEQNKHTVDVVFP